MISYAMSALRQIIHIHLVALLDNCPNTSDKAIYHHLQPDVVVVFTKYQDTFVLLQPVTFEKLEA
ncbi:hypothetical protein X798_03922 [Onchocerca flexuosa]|uniref:Uncharacterized protein n=1 Tax=Onchocerca flexuosa TaxID=387005 RepID=A0A238BUP2_9BILA|nr:hypothetical protein X798_03922 [Onchocerca flexuosa]